MLLPRGLPIESLKNYGRCVTGFETGFVDVGLNVGVNVTVDVAVSWSCWPGSIVVDAEVLVVFFVLVVTVYFADFALHCRLADELK